MPEQLIDYRSVEACPAVHISMQGSSVDTSETVMKTVVEEYALTIVLNGIEVATLVSSKDDIDELAVGYLAASGMLCRREDIGDIQVDAAHGIVRMTTAVPEELQPCSGGTHITGSGYGRGEMYCERADLPRGEERVISDMRIPASEVLYAADRFQNRSIAYKKTHGVHSAALCENGELLVFKEDIGRHNAIDRVFGYCILHDIPTKDRILLTSGRVCSEAIQKVARREVPVIVSIAAPTCQAVDAASRMGITLVGSAKDGQMDVFTWDERIRKTEPSASVSL